MDLPHFVIPAALYNAMLCSLIVMASWHFISIADGLRKQVLARKDSTRGRD